MEMKIHDNDCAIYDGGNNLCDCRLVECEIGDDEAREGMEIER